MTVADCKTVLKTIMQHAASGALLLACVCTAGLVRAEDGIATVVASIHPASISVAAVSSGALEAPQADLEPPRIRSLLEHGWATESGQGQKRNRHLAASLYCQAARLGSAEGHYRAGNILAAAGDANLGRAMSFYTTAGQLGHEAAAVVLEKILAIGGEIRQVVPECLTGDPFGHALIFAEDLEEARQKLADMQKKEEQDLEDALAVFDLDAYLSSFKPEKARIASLVARYAPDFGIEPRLALAIASVESNFDPAAVSPRNAHGVMQLIPDTARRFNVKNLHDPVESIRGGLAYLRWLTNYFSGDVVRVIAAYNAGEGAVDRYSGLPPYEETRMYVRRVLDLAGLSRLVQPAVAKR